MPGLINRVPQGLLSLLDLKTQGQNARILSPELQSTIELLDFYLSAQRETVTQSLASGTGPQATTLTPPNGFVWFVRQVCAFSNADIAAAAFQSIAVGFIPVSTGQFVGLGEPSEILTVGQRCISSYASLFVLQPGDALAYFGLVSTAGPGNVRVTAVLTEVSV